MKASKTSELPPFGSSRLELVIASMAFILMAGLMLTLAPPVFLQSAVAQTQTPDCESDDDCDDGVCCDETCCEENIACCDNQCCAEGETCGGSPDQCCINWQDAEDGTQVCCETGETGGGCCKADQTVCGDDCCSSTESCQEEGDVKKCCPTGETLCGGECTDKPHCCDTDGDGTGDDPCDVPCLTRSDDTEICCAAGERLCNDACCAETTPCCDTTDNGEDDNCGGQCADSAGNANAECFQCDTNDNENNDACYICDLYGQPTGNSGFPFFTPNPPAPADGIMDSCGCEPGKCPTPISTKEEYDACKDDLVQDSQLNSGPNGCGPTGSATDPNTILNDPCGLGNTGFMDACNEHDKAWGTCGDDKAKSDTDFKKDMLKICEAADTAMPPNAANVMCADGSTCEDKVDQYHNLVINGGAGFDPDDHHEDSQVDACVCCK